MIAALRIITLLFVILPKLVTGWAILSTYRTKSNRVSFLPLALSTGGDDNNNDDYVDDGASWAEPFTLSSSDLERLARLRNRRRNIPVVVLDALLPGQRLHFSVRDARFRVLAHYLQSSGDDALGMIGFDPVTGDPLTAGVTVKIERLLIEEHLTTIELLGHEIFQVEQEPVLDATKSYYTADVEIVDFDAEPELSDEHQLEAQRLHDELPNLVQEWLKWLYKTGKATPESMIPRFPDQNMPNEIGARAVWASALVNPLPSLGVCLEIRPSLLVCQTDLERVRLANASFKASIDHLSGKQKLF